MRRTLMFMGILSTLVLARSAAGQLPVIDATNLTQNTISAANAVIQTAKWVLELTGLPTFILAEGAFLEDLATLQRLVQEGQAVEFDLASLQAQLSLFDLSAAPMTSTAYALHMAEIRGVVNQSYSYAMRTQTLISTTLNVIRHVTVLLGDVMAAVGNLQAGQTIAQHEAQLVQVQSELKLQTAAFQHAASVDQLSGPFIEQSSENMSQAIWADWAEGDVGL